MEKVMPVKPVTHLSEILDMYNTQHTYIHMVWNNLGFGGVFDASEPRFGETLDPLEKVKVPVYPFEQSRKGVGQWTFLLGCVRLGHRNIQNQDSPNSCKDSLCFARSGNFQL